MFQTCWEVTFSLWWNHLIESQVSVAKSESWLMVNEHFTSVEILSCLKLLRAWWWSPATTKQRGRERETDPCYSHSELTWSLHRWTHLWLKPLSRLSLTQRLVGSCYHQLLCQPAGPRLTGLIHKFNDYCWAVGACCALRHACWAGSDQSRERGKTRGEEEWFQWTHD